MKRAFTLLAIVILVAWPFRPPLLAQDGASAAAAAAEKQAADERAERTAADIQALQAANEALQTRLNGLEDELRKLRDDQASQANNNALQDQLKKLSDRIEEVDRQREADKAAIAEQLRDTVKTIEKVAAGGPATPSRRNDAEPVAVNDSPSGADGAFNYTIKDGDSLSVIVRAYNAEFKSKAMKTITLKQAMDANPGVDWTRLKVGQKILIPRPAD